MSYSLLDRCTAAAKNQESLKHQSGELQTSQWCKNMIKAQMQQNIQQRMHKISHHLLCSLH